MSSDIRALDLNLLKTLDALLDEGSVTRAAQRLSLTQPAVSAMLTRLRDFFDDPLFIRAQRGMVPTARALALAGPVKQVLSDISVLLAPVAFEPSESRITYTIAATDYALKAVVVPLMAALKQQAPGIRVAVVAVDHGRLGRQLEQGEVDMALVTPQTTPEDLHSQPLYQEQYVCMMRASHPHAGDGPLSMETFCSLEHILVSGRGSFRGPTDEALAALGRSRRVGLVVNSFLVLSEMLRATDMIAVVPRRLACRQEQMAVMAPPLDIPGFTKSMAWHERVHRDPAHQWIRALCAQVSQAGYKSR
ncbi:LysR family transcriptional regulator [Shimwellia blattae]|uniref:Transcriptional regulator n=1 Tax=Shimwellia blattae (strain ATCC 29907 / DSM 4481 / JCM 1650 / NBRC 105725 / CDC 9005-74) TaxID=630626 RepID=I2BBD0_SHIBC|nr:LysR family transcriptional regulator [Shimwellia blattae]AFJ47834.1 transcriptional regulator [Shimwellia blattae DSM 4481 = NBRC 105725]GAB79595.1 LysR family transcriptional regulator LeuO [Shimwellia blattae DSM 4481 = NBRC 105725]VDY65330.1 Symbiotic regulator homolog 1 [Shimwellia blattae]VEC24256.1 Symbiotic regulator homolog 1 [Shimwellia blattae]